MMPVCLLPPVLLATNTITADSAEGKTFSDQLDAVCAQLAQLVVRDGEGASKFITINVQSALSVDEARQVAYTIAHSPLVKTAFFASDPNWGRILAAIGRAGVENLDIEKVSIYLDDVCIVSAGERAASYTEEQGTAVMQQDDISINIDLNRGLNRPPCGPRICHTNMCASTQNTEPDLTTVIPENARIQKVVSVCHVSQYLESSGISLLINTKSYH